MINFSKLTLSTVKATHRKFNVLGKNYLFTSSSKNKKMSEKIDLKKEFQEMLNETKISDDEALKKKMEEEVKKKLTMEQAKKDFEEKNQNLKKEWEHKRNNSEEDKEESELNVNHLKKKIKSAFYFNTTNAEGKESKSDESKEQKETKSKKSEESEKGPNKVSQMFSSFAKVWRQTFPGEENLELLLEKRKQEALLLKSKIKEPTEEEVAAIEANIPEWKRGAIVLVQDQGSQEKYSIFDVAKKNIAVHIRNLKIYQQTQQTLNNSEINLLLSDLKTSYSNVKENLKESQNPFFAVTRDLADRVKFTSTSSQATIVMRKHDPDFNIIDFEKEVNAIFKQLMTAFIKDDLDTVKLVAAETALAVLTNEIKSRRERKIECKYKELLYIDNAQYHSANVIDENTCVLRFRISTQEINCKISQKDGKVVEGDVDLVENIQYVIDITRNPEPVIEEVGHPYLIVGLERIGVMRQIV